MKKIILIGVLIVFSLNAHAIANSKTTKVFLEMFEKYGASEEGSLILEKELHKAKISSDNKKKLNDLRKVLYDELSSVVEKEQFDEDEYKKISEGITTTYFMPLIAMENAYLTAFKKLNVKDRRIAAKVMREIQGRRRN